jgi:hypothetical protein
MSKPRKLCIFCGRPGVTKEHIWADWLAPYLPRGQINHERLSETAYQTHVVQEIKKQSGSSQSGTVRVVCRECNNGWMSALQNAAKPILVPLLKGERAALFKKAQNTLAAWTAMFTMVAEFQSRTPRRVAIPAAHRRHLMDTRTVPSDWKIWVGCYERQSWPRVYVHNTLPVSSESGSVHQTDDGLPLPNTQTTTFVVGKLYVHVLSTAIRGGINRQRILMSSIAQLWPFKTSPVGWPRTPLTDDEAERIAMTYVRGAEIRSQLLSSAD